MAMADTASPEEIKEISTTLHKASKVVYKLLENLLEWSRLQMGRIELHPVKFDLAELVEQNTLFLHETAINKQIALQNSIYQELFIYADKHMLDTVVRNLISNALKFTHPNGVVTISAEVMTDFVEVTVSDTGVGIDREDIDKIFQIQLHHSTAGTAEEKGTGLGLVICQEMIQKNNGEIWIESELNKGTMVKFTVPLYQVDEISDEDKVMKEIERLYLRD
jgi:signal transduction histidine kinase